VAVALAMVQQALEVTAAVGVGIIIMFLLSMGSGRRKGDGGRWLQWLLLLWIICHHML